MSDEPKSNYEDAKETLGKDLEGAELEAFERTCLLLEAHQSDVEDVLDDMGEQALVDRKNLLEAQVRHARKLVIGYAGLAVAFGSKAGLVDGNGEATGKLSEAMAKTLVELNDGLADFKEIFEEIFPEETFEDVDLEVEDIDGDEADEKEKG